MANRRNTRRSEHCIENLFLQWQRTQTKPVKFIWHSRLWAQRVKTLQETITFADKRKSLLVIQIQEALWRKLNNVKPCLAATKNVNFGSEGQSCRPETKPTENQYACHDLSVWYKRQKSHLLNQNLEPSRRKKRIGTSSIILSILVNSLTFVCFFS